MARQRVTPEIRAAALADLHAGEQPAVVADRYGLDGATVRKWKQRLVTPTVTEHVTPDVTVSRAPVARPQVARQQAEIGALVLDLLAAKFRASEAIAKAVTDEAWLKQQPASELAALGEWLDATALAIGDRLAGRPRPAGDADGEPSA